MVADTSKPPSLFCRVAKYLRAAEIWPAYVDPPSDSAWTANPVELVELASTPGKPPILDC